MLLLVPAVPCSATRRPGTTAPWRIPASQKELVIIRADRIGEQTRATKADAVHVEGPIKAVFDGRNPIPVSTDRRPCVLSVGGYPNHMTVAKASVLVLDCAEPEALAEFYASLLDAKIQVVSDPDSVELVGHNGIHVAIRREHGYAPPSWPRPQDALCLGVVPMDTKDSSGPRSVRFHADLAGHSFSFAVSPRNEPPGRGRKHHEAA